MPTCNECGLDFTEGHTEPGKEVCADCLRAMLKALKEFAESLPEEPPGCDEIAG